MLISRSGSLHVLGSCVSSELTEDRLLTAGRTLYVPANPRDMAACNVWLQPQGSYVGYRTPGSSPYTPPGTPYPMDPRNPGHLRGTQRAPGDDQYTSVTAHSIFPTDYIEQRNRRVYSTHPSSPHQAHERASANISDNTPVAASHADGNKGDVRTYQDSPAASTPNHGSCRCVKLDELPASGVDTSPEDFHVVTDNRDEQSEDGNGSDEDGGLESNWQWIRGRFES